jgi:predicted DCC family thiol-disulfide oxidoreductase YuxK
MTRRSGARCISAMPVLCSKHMSQADSGPVLLYDGVCGLCDRSVQFLLRHDKQARFRFAALQGEFAHGVLSRHGRDPAKMDYMVLVLDAGLPTERLLDRSDGVLAVLKDLGGGWRLLAASRAIPRSLRDRAYDFVARHRYGWFGRYDHCVLPSPSARARFIADEGPGGSGAMSA